MPHTDLRPVRGAAAGHTRPGAGGRRSTPRLAGLPWLDMPWPDTPWLAGMPRLAGKPRLDGTPWLDHGPARLDGRRGSHCGRPGFGVGFTAQHVLDIRVIIESGVEFGFAGVVTRPKTPPVVA
ncbi:hypothetical protein, partial [Mycobacterium kiyosense]|uniref:hypothetical protein n=4 Tax=Mycobacterium kiyosense TaxID=2871094 RepID=UPI0022311DAC